MDDRQAADALARNRWIVIQAVRFTGVAMVLAGILIARQVIAAPAAAGWLFLAAGLFSVFVTPRALARHWRTPPE